MTSNGARLRPRVRELYEGQLRLHILPTLGRAPLSKLRTTTVRSWYATLTDSGPGPSTAAKCYRLLRAILNTAVEDGLLAVNPCTIRGAGAEPAPERVIPTIPQVLSIAEVVDPRYRALVLLAALGGLRRGELFGLQRRHVDLAKGLVTVEAQRQQLAHGELVIGPPKSEAGRRTVAVPPQALHPGAQTSLFPSLEYRYWGHYSDAEGDPVVLDARRRAHAHVEDHIRRLKDSGLCRFPFTDIDANRTWLAVVCFPADLVRWFQLLCLAGALALAEPKALRWRLWHTPARLVRHARREVVCILDGWPTEAEILAAYRRIALII